MDQPETLTCLFCQVSVDIDIALPKEWTRLASSRDWAHLKCLAQAEREGWSYRCNDCGRIGRVISGYSGDKKYLPLCHDCAFDLLEKKRELITKLEVEVVKLRSLVEQQNQHAGAV